MESPQKTILVVDDDRTILDTVSLGIETAGFKVLKANGGRAAFDIARRQHIDTIITDVQMPDGNGAVLLREVKALPKHENTYVIFMADLADISLEQAYDLGAEAVFIKPFSNKNLIEHLKLILAPEVLAHKRSPSRMKVGRGFDIKASDLKTGLEIQLNDIGIGGFAVKNPPAMPNINDLVPFTIQLTGDLFILFKGKGVVRWTRPASGQGSDSSYGVEFSEFDKSNSLKAAELINFLKTKKLITTNTAQS